MLTNEEIISGCIKNDRRSQKELFDRFGAKMYGHCLRYSPSSADAQDLLQEGFMKIFDSIQSLRDVSFFEGWMTRIFINMALSKFRKAKSGPTIVDIDHVDAPEEIEVEEGSMNQLSADQVLELMKQLPEKYALVLNMYAIDNLTHKEIAQYLNTSESNSKSMLSRARKMLKDLIEEKQNNNEIEE